MNRRIITFTVFIILALLIIPTVYKIYENHKEHLILVVEKEFLYQAKLCYYEDACSNQVTLKDLYQKEYLKEKLTNPISKEYYREDSYVNIETNEIRLIS